TRAGGHHLAVQLPRGVTAGPVIYHVEHSAHASSVAAQVLTAWLIGLFVEEPPVGVAGARHAENRAEGRSDAGCSLPVW
ncbi:hypothetical protein, partial [Amycolatopsis sp. KNN50.9b]|uniref:hypothetical protein n=1 Tax=Amycolatopsis sp. KNN50.9b TaxID=2018303 RepID=UPI001E4D6E5A